MIWKEQAPEAAAIRLDDLLQHLTTFDALGIMMRLRNSPAIFFSPACRTGIRQHLQSGSTELGGLLLGRPYAPDPTWPGGWGPVLCVDDFVPSRSFRSSRVSLVMQAEVWDRARETLVNSRGMVVGWYHSHPDLGAFFSSTDRTTQRAFFDQPYCVGLVIDPVRDEEAWFVGPSSSRVDPESIFVQDLRVEKE